MASQATFNLFNASCSTSPFIFVPPEAKSLPQLTSANVCVKIREWARLGSPQKRGENQLRLHSWSHRVSETGSDRRGFLCACIEMELNWLLLHPSAITAGDAVIYKTKKKQEKERREIKPKGICSHFKALTLCFHSKHALLWFYRLHKLINCFSSPTSNLHMLLMRLFSYCITVINSLCPMQLNTGFACYKAIIALPPWMGAKINLNLAGQLLSTLFIV